MTMASAPNPDAIYLLHEGTQYQSYRFLGAHIVERDSVRGVHFAVWAPNAKQVNVSGSFNGWDGRHHGMTASDGVWTLFIPELEEGTLYKYEIITLDDECYLKADPYAFSSELRPGTASRVTSLDGYVWQDGEWLSGKAESGLLRQPLLIYEVHLGSWKRKEDGGFYSYVEIADQLVDYVAEHGFTHIELMPLAEHPLDQSWGYQVTGYYSVTSRFGTPQEFMYLVDRCHQRGIGVLMDWVPAHFCKDAHGLARFDGTPLYEYADNRKGDHPTWGTHVFDYGKPEVQSFLISNALFWMDVYHIDGLRVDAVYSMLTLNFGRKAEDCITNEQGGEENLEGIAFLRKLNAVVFARYPNALMMAEDSSSFPGVTRGVDQGGLGFNYKWNLSFSWHTLDYMKKSDEERTGLKPQLTHSLEEARKENYILPYAHDEMVEPDKSLLGKMSGTDSWQRFANLRVLYAYMIAHPGKKLLFMGSEFGQMREWRPEAALDWELLKDPAHEQLRQYTAALNHFYISEKALWEQDFDPSGFEDADLEGASDGLVQFTRQGKDDEESLMVVCNFRPEPHEGYRIGVAKPARYQEVFNSDRHEYGGSGVMNAPVLIAEEWSCQNRPYSIAVTIPPLAAVMFKQTQTEG
ncbi:1,4-alpha-glucan branching protein GlgB [Paenibacillus sp. GCM10023248]|uniref:1,4-alpha-glucan branching protein GlgB n=1 Tax=unclassified Paenibacillus TaxID=185978 RepID=UPI0023782AE2|nr:1,4-alpha-glucan branching protein GlgB [Paenibacillus sp. MAHUQ-63]MDD9271006.1 1,4-alpha-glucan branching protein GlgB [Paenibacillus sp. MAHUQ-63]